MEFLLTYIPRKEETARIEADSWEEAHYIAHNRREVFQIVSLEETKPMVCCCCGTKDGLKTFPIMTGDSFVDPDPDKAVCRPCIEAWYDGNATKNDILKARGLK